MIDIFLDTPTGELNKAVNLTIDQIEKTNEMTARDLEKRALGLFKGTTRNWRHDVEFVADIDFGPDGITLIAGTDDMPYFFLDKGTRVRRALLSPDWKSKTQPGSLKSGKGRGRVLVINKKFNFPGIKARDFSGRILDIISRELEPTFNRNAKKVIR